MNAYRPRYFELVELVDPQILAERGERAWELLRPDALQMLVALREKFGPIVVNGTYLGHTYTESGLRRFDTGTGAKWSMHRYGGAYDMKFLRVTPREVSVYVLAHPDEFPMITTLEDVEQTVTWLHGDCRNHSRQGIWVVNP